MTADVQCPYFQYEKEGVLHCECLELRFPDAKVRREIVYGYCAHPEHYRQCPWGRAMDHHYERRFS